MCERWVGDWTKTATYWTPALLAIAAFLSHSAGLLNLESLRAASPLSESWFSLPQTATNWLQLNELPVAPGYIIVWCPPASCEHRICTQFNPFTVKVIPWYLRPDAPVPWSMAGLEVNMLHSLTHSWEDKGGSYLSHGYLSESECDSMTGLWTCFLRSHSPVL